MSKYGCIYIIENIKNKKVYVGKTMQNIEDRFSQHIKKAFRDNDNTKLYSAIRKHGPENFRIKKIRESILEEDLNKTEIEEIKKLDSFNNGYNSTEGGDGGININSIEECSVPIICQNTGIVYKNAREAGRILGLDYKNINQVCRGEKRMHKGYVFDYKTHDTGSVLDFQAKRSKLNRQEKNNRILNLQTKKVYNSFSEASKDSDVTPMTVKNHCLNLVKNPKFKFFNMKKILYVGDYHCQVSNLKDSESLMSFIIELTEKEKVDAIVFLGDQFHTHAVLRLEVIDFWSKKLKLLNLMCPTYLLIGNHDMKGDNESTAEDINSMISFNTETVLLENIKIINKPTVVESIGMVPYYKREKDFFEACKYLYEEGATGCLIAHQTFTGAQYENGFFSNEGIDPALVPQQEIISGHIHKSQQVGKCFYPGIPKWESMSDANQPKGLYIIEHTEDGLIKQKEFFSTEHIVTPIKSYEIKEGDEMPELNPKARNYVVLEGKSAWITRTKKKFKDIANIKVKPTDRLQSVNTKSESIEDYLKKHFDTISGVTKDELIEFLRELV